MTAHIISEAEDELESAFRYYESMRRGLGSEMLDEFRSGIEQILRYPDGWQVMDRTYRRYRLHRFPYGIIYRFEAKANIILVMAFFHLSRRPRAWRTRDKIGP